MKILKLIALSTLGLFLVSCSPPTEEQVVQTYTVLAGTVEVIEAGATQTPAPTETPVPTPTATPTWTTTAFTNYGPVNLRNGPGTYFDSYGSLQDETMVYVLGTIPGGDWFEVLAPHPTEDYLITGWIFSSFLEVTAYTGTIPITTWPETQTIYGIVTDDNGNPINGVRVAAVYQSDEEEIRDDTPTNENGEFSIYLPLRVTGPYDVQITAVNCNSSISVWLDDGTCEVQDYFPVEWRTYAYMPLDDPIHFYYEEAATHLNGKISYSDGWGYPNILVKATRLEDGVESERVSPSNGRVSIPLGYGTWEVVAIKFDWYGVPTYSDRVTYVVTEEGQVLEDFNVIIDDINNPE